MNKLMATGATALCTSTALFAGTVAWYHFDELPDVVGNGVKAGTTFENSANPGVLRGVADTANSVSISGGDWAVKTSGDWDSSMLVMDPATSAKVENGKAMTFGWAANNAGSGVVRIQDASSALPTANFTVEFFIRLDSVGSQRVLVSRGDYVANGYYWYLEVTAANKLQFYVANGGAAQAANNNQAGNVAFNDGKWHHVAIRRAGGAYWAAYLDYAVAAVLQPGVASNFLSGKEIVFGRMPGIGTAGISGCPLDELRISDTGLDPAQMLGFAESDYSVADGTVSHLRFDTVPGYVVPATFDWAKHPTGKATIVAASGGTVALQNGNAVATAGNGARTLGAADRGSLLFTGDATTHASGYLTVPDVATTLGGDFTVETFFKTSGAPFGGGTDSGYLFDAAGQWRIRFLSSGGAMQVINGWNSVWQIAGYDDGEWHHFAFTYDAAADVGRVYLDYALKFTKTDWALAAPTTLAAGGLSSASDGNYTFGDLALDELRVMARALSPTEFLTSEYVAGPTLLWAGFDNSLAVDEPVSVLSPAGTVSGTTLWASGCGTEVKLADGTVLKASNPASLALSSGATATFLSPLVCVPTNTVEFFIRPSAVSSDAPLVALWGGLPSAAAWTLGFGADGETLVFTPAGGAAASTGLKAKSGAWSHVALVVATPASGNSTVKVAVDGTESVLSLGSRLAVSPADPKLVLGGTGLAAQIDELRVSEGELTAARRMKYFPSATTIMMR